MKPYKDEFDCPECGKVTKIEVHPYVRAITSHQYEDNSEAEGGYVEPEECPDCGHGIYYEDYEG
jgi:predicted RNA-binding Zn-ribbon protein involved in translation (DUF1610 family)